MQSSILRLQVVVCLCVVYLWVALACSCNPQAKRETTKSPRQSPAQRLIGYSFSTDPSHQGVHQGRIGSGLRRLWSTRIGIFGYHNHPLVVNNVIIVSSYGRAWNRCDAADGVYLVQRSTGRRLHFFPTRCDANGIATDGRTLYAVTDGGELFAWDLNTRVLRYRTAPGGSKNKLYAPPLILSAGLFISGGRGFAALVDPTRGTVVRRFGARGTIRNHSALGNRVVFGGGDNTTWIYELTGRLRGTWKNSGDEGSVYGAPAVTAQHVAVAGPYDGSGSADAWAVLDAKTTRRLWKMAPLVGSKASPAIFGGVAYFASSGERDEGSGFSVGSLEAFDIATGKSLWELKNLFGSWSSPIVVGDKIVWIGTGGTLMLVRRKDGKVIRDLHLGAKVYATPAIAEGVVYVGGDDGRLHAIDTR